MRKYRPESVLVPGTEDPQKYALFEQAMSVEAFDFAPPLSVIAWEKRYKKCVTFLQWCPRGIRRANITLKLDYRMRGLTTDEARVAEEIKKFEEKLEGYERILSKQKYIAGNVSPLPLKSLMRTINLTTYMAFPVQEFTFADISHIMLGAGLSLFLEIDLLSNAEKWPSVARWFADITSRQSWLETKKEWLALIGHPTE